MILYRIAKKQYLSKLDGLGSYLHGGRWTPIGTHAVYTAQHRSLAYLEYVVHQMGPSAWPKDLGIAILAIDDSSVFDFALEDLPDGWDHVLLQDHTKVIGPELFAAGHMAFSIPSVIVPEERNIIIDPLHESFADQVSITSIEDLELDKRFMTV